ncbi:MAG: ISL3 family transposase [Planctomycetales bacterium]|nr:ISL3 family transposase [Planctomycetales bacterium]
MRVTFADEKVRHTRAFERYAWDLSQAMTIRDVARHLGASWDTIKDIQKRFLVKHFARPKLKSLEQIAIDEIAIGKGHRYVTLVLDLKSGAMVFVGNGKGANALEPFWKRLRASGAKVQAVAADLSPAYALAVRRNLPGAVLVNVRFVEPLPPTALLRFADVRPATEQHLVVDQLALW